MKHIERAVLDRLQAKQLAGIITQLGEVAQKKYGKQVFEGDCGQWAWAVRKYLNDPRCKLGLITEKTHAKTIRELDDYEPYIFHVWVEYDGHKFDASGEIDDDYLMDFMEGYEGADDTQTWEDLTADEPLRQLISGSTNWKHEWPLYYKLFKVSEKKVVKSSLGYELDSRQLASDRGNKGIGYLNMPCEIFLRLTTNPNNEKFSYEHIMNSVEPYVQGKRKYILMPWLDINMETGKVVGHEGRHRAASLIKAGVKTMPVSIHLKNEEGRTTYKTYDYDSGKESILTEGDIPPVITAQFTSFRYRMNQVMQSFKHHWIH